MTRRSFSYLLTLPAAIAVRAQSPSAPVDAYTTFDADGTAHITRALPVPKTISPEAQSLMMPGQRWVPAGGTKERAAWLEKMQTVYPVDVKDTTVAGVDAWVVAPKHPAAKKRECVLICLHGGGFTSDWGSQIESIPIAALTGTQVISVRAAIGILSICDPESLVNPPPCRQISTRSRLFAPGCFGVTTQASTPATVVSFTSTG